MTDRRFNPLAAFLSLAWAVLVGAVVVTVAVNLLRSIWPWLLGITAVTLFIVVALRLLTHARSRQW